MVALKQFYLDETLDWEVHIHQQWNSYASKDVITDDDLVEVLKGGGYCASFSSDDAPEFKALRNQLLSLGNTRDDSGNYLFSGTRVKTPAFAEDVSGQVVYQGDQTQTRIPAGVERTVQFTRAGTDVFSRVVRENTDKTTTSVGFFDALDQMIQGVEGSRSDKINQGISDLNQMHNNLVLSQVQNGSDQSVVQSQLDVLDETTLRFKSTLSEIEDLDYAAAVTRMNKEMMALEAAMGSFSKISGLSLFDYIRG
jgi:flagellar hook-associated protein 3 FlgL